MITEIINMIDETNRIQALQNILIIIYAGGISIVAAVAIAKSINNVAAIKNIHKYLNRHERQILQAFNEIDENMDYIEILKKDSHNHNRKNKAGRGYLRRRNIKRSK